MQQDLQSVIDGGVAGGVATAAMSVVMLAAEKAGFMGEQPPEEVARAALDAAGVSNPPEEVEDALAVLGHFGFGIAAGALFGLLHRRLRLPVPAAVQGVVFASLVWAASYKGWIPALGILPPPERDRPGRPPSMVLAHWVYGGTLGALVGRESMKGDR